MAHHYDCLSKTYPMRGHNICFCLEIRKIVLELSLTLLHSEQTKLHRVLAVLSAIGLNAHKGYAKARFFRHPCSITRTFICAHTLYLDLEIILNHGPGLYYALKMYFLIFKSIDGL